MPLTAVNPLLDICLDLYAADVHASTETLLDSIRRWERARIRAARRPTDLRCAKAHALWSDVRHDAICPRCGSVSFVLADWHWLGHNPEDLVGRLSPGRLGLAVRALALQTLEGRNPLPSELNRAYGALRRAAAGIEHEGDS